MIHRHGPVRGMDLEVYLFSLEYGDMEMGTAVPSQDT